MEKEVKYLSLTLDNTLLWDVPEKEVLNKAIKHTAKDVYCNN